MSWYYVYYIGYKKDDKIFPFGLYNANGKLKPVLEKSRSFASDLHEILCPGVYLSDVNKVKKEEISEELRKEFEYEDFNGEKTLDVWYVSLSELPEGSFIKTGYFLNEDINIYLKEGKDPYDDLFWDRFTPEQFAIKTMSELRYGVPKSQKDIEGYEIPVHSCSEYSYFAYPDYYCKEYESYLIRIVSNMLTDYNELPEGAEAVVLMTQG